MKKTYKTFNGENRNCFIEVCKAFVGVRFTPTYTTDNELVQKAIEDTHAFKVGEIQLVTPPMTWIKIDRDENGFATEECLCKIRKSMPCSLAIKYQNTVVYMSLNNELDFANKYDSIKTQKIITHYLPIPKFEV